jgi:hypothetical protein
MKKYLIFSLLLQIGLIFGFLYFAHQADLAMGKDGIGDVAKWNILNRYAGISFYTLVGIWFISILVSLIKQGINSIEGQLTVGLPPIILVVGWVFLWFI